MGASGSKARGLWPFASAAGGGGPEAAVAEQALVRPRGRVVPPFVFTRRGGGVGPLWVVAGKAGLVPSVGDGAWGKRPSPSSMFYDEDGDLAHEFYEETIVTKNGQKRAKLRRVHKNLIPQGIVKLDPPRIHVDFPVILYEV
ncbi:tumor suppressor candidate 2 isoform X1 [Mesoplodon densirostris]|uniref:tumor suppressor candidate 2 isoform X1 n=1 Tax=Mesoplodon densirostris TaxID=48708 RepID=UPI0028DCC26D|nr:tumor suppressor candidate 2 isoform X1 [Mesoplodon densirostris]